MSSTIELIRFVFGNKVPTSIPTHHKSYYANFFSDFFQLDFSVQVESQESLNTLPVPYGEAVDNPQVLCELLENRLFENQYISQSGSFNSYGNLFVVDVSDVKRDRLLIALNSYLASLFTDGDFRLVIVIDDVRSNRDKFKALYHLFGSRKAVFIDMGSRFFDGKEIKTHLDFNMNAVSRSPLERLKYRTIRKIGHFHNKKHPNDITCKRFFYDCSDCYSLLVELFIERIISLKTERDWDTELIIFSGEDSPWLGDSLARLDMELLKIRDEFDLGYKGYIHVDNLSANMEKVGILVIEDLILTGWTINRDVELVIKAMPNAKFEFISVMANTSHPKIKKVEESILNLRLTKLGEVKIDYFLDVAQDIYGNFHGECPMCNDWKLDFDDPLAEVSSKLSSFESWTMTDEVGYGDEQIVNSRPNGFMPKLPLQPNTLSLIKKNGALLARKYGNLVERKGLYNAHLVIVFADERTSAKYLEDGLDIALEDTPSGHYVETLSQLLGYEYFGIPRIALDLIPDFDNGTINPNLSFIQDDPKFKAFYSKLRLLSDHIIITDEFGYSGNTLNKICAILKWIGKPPKAYIPIFNYFPIDVEPLVLKELEVHSLYGFNMPKHIHE